MSVRANDREWPRTALIALMTACLAMSAVLLTGEYQPWVGRSMARSVSFDFGPTLSLVLLFLSFCVLKGDRKLAIYGIAAAVWTGFACCVPTLL